MFCFVICLPSKPKEATGGEGKWGRESSKRFCFSAEKNDEDETSVQDTEDEVEQLLWEAVFQTCLNK